MAYIAFTKGYKSKFTYFMRTIESFEVYVDPIQTPTQLPEKPFGEDQRPDQGNGGNRAHKLICLWSESWYEYKMKILLTT